MITIVNYMEYIVSANKVGGFPSISFGFHHQILTSGKIRPSRQKEKKFPNDGEIDRQNIEPLLF